MTRAGVWFSAPSFAGSPPYRGFVWLPEFSPMSLLQIALISSIQRERGIRDR